MANTFEGNAPTGDAMRTLGGFLLLLHFQLGEEASHQWTQRFASEPMN
jgi:hypothetical protein